MNAQPLISAEAFDAIIFDLDGVITRTARVHARAWKTVFDEFLERWSQRTGRPVAPFDASTDYLEYVDGRPRDDGVTSFLASRGIRIPRGTSRDAVTAGTICGIGNRKNELFNELLRSEGVETYEHGVELVREAREAGLRTAVISSSRNCVPVLESVDALALFDARIDGVDAERMGLAGKPAPDVFLSACRALSATPERTVVVEDALSGVEAGRAGDFGLVVGVDRSGQADALRRHGADLVVSDLAQLKVEGKPDGNGREAVPPVARPADLAGRLHGGRPALFLDYDGTLTPIVDRPELAVLDDPTRAIVRRLAGLCPVAVISGRDLDDLRKRVAVDGIVYAGSHGFDIAGPGGLSYAHPAALDALPRLDAAESGLRETLRAVEGALVERKRFSIAAHYRLVADDQVRVVADAVDAEIRRAPGLRKGLGKKVFELRPDVDWNKGAAVLWLLETLGLEDEAVTPVYIGDDVTDEDAFRALEQRGHGLGVAVMDPPRPTAARYRVSDPGKVYALLASLVRFLEARP